VNWVLYPFVLLFYASVILGITNHSMTTRAEESLSRGQRVVLMVASINLVAGPGYYGYIIYAWAMA
jgi:hypothetical protein